MDADLDEMLDAAICAARQAGALLRLYYERGVVAQHKGAIDLVTEADRASEALILKMLSEQFPDHAFYAEESGASGNHSSHVWVIDPLDGTTNFAHGFPVFCATLALQIDGRAELGVTFDPLREELFTAQRGRGAFLNDRPIHVSGTPHLSSSLLVTGFPYDRQTSAHNNLRQHTAMLMKSQGVLRVGSAALDLASVACGRLDGFWEFKLSSWDWAAGALLVEEAGGRVTDMSGSRLDPRGRDLVASNGLIHDGMLDVLRQTWNDER
ncbi:MAG TPA: inositol monophosphatase family protein [Anaerolineae bacterium]|nr:inositol monophosphatase family protein [Anaerolineae bacterium]